MTKMTSDQSLSFVLKLLKKKNYEEAIVACDQILMEDERLPKVVLTRGIANFGLLRFTEAERDLLSCIDQGLDSIEVFYHLAQLRCVQGKQIEAFNTLKQGLVICNDRFAIAEWGNRLSELYFKVGKPRETIFWGNKYLKHDPSNYDCNRRMALAYSMLQQPLQALIILKKLLIDHPDDPELHFFISVLLRQTRNFSLASYHLQVAGDLDQSLYDPWNLLLLSASVLDFQRRPLLLKESIDLVKSQAGITEPFCMFFATDEPDIVKNANELHSEKFKLTDDRFRSYPERIHNARLRIGYLSSDFKSHATSFLIEKLLSLHDRNQFEIFGFDISANDGSNLRDRILGAFDEVIDLSNCSDEESAMRISNCNIDILVDLKGYTEGGRPKIFSYRPSKIQINYLGYPGTVGGKNHDYIIGDSVVFSAESEQHFSEKQIRLPCCYQPNNPTRQIGEQTTRSEHGLPDEAFVLCCFNHHWKLNPEVIRTWTSILQQRPDSILWVLENISGIDVTDRLAKFGIKKQQIVVAPLVSIDKHLERIRHANLFLDTFPCGAHTTASDAIFAGIPVMNILGRSFHSRVSASLMVHAGEPAFVCESLDEYSTKTLACIDNPEILTNAKATLLDFQSIHHPYNVKTTVNALEQAFVRCFESSDTSSSIKIAPWW